MIAPAKTLKQQYLDMHSVIHEEAHYFEDYGGCYLGFFNDFFLHLPGDMRETNHKKDLLVRLWDQEDDEHYDTHMVVAYKSAAALLPAAGLGYVVVNSLLPYFYGGHHCPCHRKQDARAAGADTDEECEGDRFLIERIEYKGLILASEVYTLEDLSIMLLED